MFRTSVNRRRPRGPAPTREQLNVVAADVVSVLKNLGIDSCFLGSMACSLYGTTRTPNDLDILCLTDEWEQEALKRELVAKNPRFYLVSSRNPYASYKVLWYSIRETNSCTKVDLLFPGILDIPDVPLGEIDRSNVHRLPCAPLAHLLLLKLQGWIHHGESVEEHYRQKMPADVQDILELLVIAKKRGVKPRTKAYLPESFISRASSRVKKFVQQSPSSRDNWVALGFT